MPLLPTATGSQTGHPTAVSRGPHTPSPLLKLMANTMHSSKAVGLRQGEGGGMVCRTRFCRGSDLTMGPSTRGAALGKAYSLWTLSVCGSAAWATAL